MCQLARPWESQHPEVGHWPRTNRFWPARPEVLKATLHLTLRYSVKPGQEQAGFCWICDVRVSLLWAYFTLGSAVGNLGLRSSKGKRANSKILRAPLSCRSLHLPASFPLSLLVTLLQKEFLPLVAAKRLKQRRKVKLYICLIFHQKWSWRYNLYKYYVKYK